LALPCIEKTVSLEIYLQAAELYALGRRKGFTIRSGVDCLIAAIAIKHGLPVWHNDRDYELIAEFSNLSLYQP
jgi:predicted nucleic acid-binding protein